MYIELGFADKIIKSFSLAKIAEILQLNLYIEFLRKSSGVTLKLLSLERSTIEEGWDALEFLDFQDFYLYISCGTR